jgi:DNA-binding NarL/FixJ family response regulator
MPKIIIADDHEVTRRGLRALLESHEDYDVVDEATNGTDALAKIEKHRPDFVVLDMALPGIHGLDVLQQGSRRSPNSRFVVLSMHEDGLIVGQALRAGASAYVLKGSSADDLLMALEAARRGERYLSKGLDEADVLMESPSEMDRYESLTAREREVFHLSAEGLTSAQVAEQLFISPRTVEKHRENFMAKLDLRSQLEVVRFAVERGFISRSE